MKVHALPPSSAHDFTKGVLDFSPLGLADGQGRDAVN